MRAGQVGGGIRNAVEHGDRYESGWLKCERIAAAKASMVRAMWRRASKGLTSRI